MKKIIAVLMLSIAILTLAFGSPAIAADTAAGAAVFQANCAQCHAGGKNLANAAKTLSKADLEEYNLYSQDAIIAQVTNGKNSMPKFKGKLSAEQIADVAAYVMEQAEAGW
ncbi:cytochrome C6 [Cylindrospermopsis raciborskii S07]|jgi:cytochrome c6|uniref:Cytochrome c6 n=3 Tax=Cylindrospermopsis raciborskii TaxID=77022 RepID=A0A853MCS2_9CYAN|nr:MULTISPECIES: c-type cytochrome [Cylindrospermopsis]MBU6344787.1 c-type cytochrome [Cyanobacteria bacterium REEB494]EFA69753.1 Cytochrome c, class I [Cylindrospermopsis raciborskii CS-505]KRH96023.1 cytochrome C6 [Cylindrospermopsis sp. CR12]MBA4444749.1 c-type cytochrome [Cylindrospermopsis raciborskii CS-506_C]MBA4448965.1 c-type cytochrome [Cylindrospermopsis raciborskii CS-506_D]